MGMSAVCPKDGCGYSATSDNRRGGQLGICPRCSTPLRAHTAGKAKGRYLCPITGYVTTLGLRAATQLTEPMRLVFMPGWDHVGYEPDPDRPGWNRQIVGWRAEPSQREQQDLDRAAGRVFGPGCVIGGDYLPRPTHYRDRDGIDAGVYLVTVPDADPAGWIVNTKLVYRKCAACPKKVPVTERTVMPEPWTPRRESYYAGSGWSMRRVMIDPGPHSAGTVACHACDPRRSDDSL